MPPAARLGDFHTCPMQTPATPPIPHVGGPICVGAPTVIICFQPAARQGDMAICVGPPDVIAKGSATVMICFQPAARMGDSTAHGGVITLGAPTVMIGDAGSGGPGGGAGGPGGGAAAGGIAGGAAAGAPDPGQEEYSKNLIIKGSPEFRAKVKADLDKLAATKTGKSIIDAIANGKHTVTITELDKTSAQNNGGLCTPKDAAAAKDPSKGSDSTVSYSPEFSGDKYTDQNGKEVDHPAELYLGHELIHAVHNSEGTNKANVPDPAEPDSNQEESQTIGINDHKDKDMTENNLLKDLGYDYTRTNHDMTAHSN